jgi:hypothetical protein
MTIVEQVGKILGKSKLSLQDYKDFVALSKKAKGSDLDKFAWLEEGMEIRLPEIAATSKDPNYNFVKDNKKKSKLEKNKK